MDSPKNIVVIIGTINFDKLESQTVWLIEVEKSGHFNILCCHLDFKLFCKTLNVSGSKDKVATSMVISQRRQRSQTI